MDKNNKKKKQNNSMFIYTALIFVVALIFIILAFFGQTNLSNLRRDTENEIVSETVQETPAAEEPSVQPTQLPNEELAIMANRLSNMTSENEQLKSTISVYESLLAANGYASVGNITEAEKLLGSIDVNALTDDQKILFDQITNIINEGKEQ